jgi:hypothetical protein
MQHACHLVTHKTEKSTIARDGDMHAAEQVDIVGTHIDPVFSAGAGDGIGHGVMQPSCQMMTDETEKSTIARDGDMQASKQVDIVGQHIGPVFSAGAGDGIGHGVMQPSCQTMTDETEKSTIARDGDMQASKQVDIGGQHIDPVISAGAHEGDGHGAIGLRPRAPPDPLPRALPDNWQ